MSKTASGWHVYPITAPEYLQDKQGSQYADEDTKKRPVVVQ